MYSNAFVLRKRRNRKGIMKSFRLNTTWCYFFYYYVGLGVCEMQFKQKYHILLLYIVHRLDRALTSLSVIRIILAARGGRERVVLRYG